jgi:hypothetical protein
MGDFSSEDVLNDVLKSIKSNDPTCVEVNVNNLPNAKAEWVRLRNTINKKKKRHNHHQISCCRHQILFCDFRQRTIKLNL